MSAFDPYRTLRVCYAAAGWMRARYHLEMDVFRSPQFVEAVRLWVGHGENMAPSRSDKRVTDRFGNELGSKMLPVMKSLETDFYSSDARFVAPNLQEMGTMASEQFKRLHPTVPDEIVKTFAWCYTFDFK